MKTTLCLLTVSALGLFVWNRAPAASSRAETYCGMCDASTVIALNEDLFVVGDDEDSVLRVFSRAKGGAAVHRFNLTSFLGFARDDEADLEGSTRLGDKLFWITSHGNNRKGEEQESRHRFFAMTVKTNNGSVRIEPVGKPYTRLLDDLLADPRMKQFNLHAALSLPPKTPGALNIEGLAATPEGHLLIGFRNPVPRGEALIVTLLNPLDLLEGKPPRFGEPQLIGLGGYGIRSIEYWRDSYLIIGGSVDGKGKSRLYQWSDGGGQPELIRGVDFEGINPEAISVIERSGGPELFVVSDDGTRKVNGVECKKLKDPMQKTFRAASVSLAPQLAAKH
ncbi:MAG TPA: DUF3616 domain-containing protein [Methylomirabilota bacterium]|nr:DUF3616 domain-containing protein [Methylomirabilota bacterium]